MFELSGGCLSVYVYKGTFVSHGTCVEVRGQLEKSVFSVYWVGPGDYKSTGLAASTFTC